ncbi:MAG TPA: NUDIX domain-containing protein [Casimicrobiaceae bacterium]
MRDGVLEVLLVHPGGPFWANKDAGAWSIPKGEFDAGEDPLAAAKREFEEETGVAIDGAFVALPSCKLRGGKTVHAWAVEADLDVERLRSNTFEIAWPPRSGRTQSFPEVDRYGYFTLDEAAEKINAGQRPLLDALVEAVIMKRPPSRPRT